MTMLANRMEKGSPALPGRALTLADYEARIHLYKEQIGTGYIGIGRTLLEAKEAKVVPHGQWESWVQETTGLTARQAQRCMQAATEIKDGTAMARLEMSKALLLLGSGLDEEAREEIAGKAVEEGATVKDLREQLRKAKLQIVQETGASAEIREELKKIRSERESMENQLKATIEAYQKRMDEECGKAYRRGVEEQATGLEKEIRKEFQDKINHINSERARLEDTRKDLLARLEEEKKGGSARWDEGYEAGRKEAVGLRNELNKQTQYAQDLKKNQDDLLAAAEEAEKRAAEAEAELDALRAGVDSRQKPMAVQLGNAVGEFMRECSAMPFYAEELLKERGAVISLLSNLEDWIDKMYAAIGMPTVDGEGAVE